MIDLLSCPFCGASDAFAEREDFTSAYVTCNHCSARGPVECQEGDDEETPGKSAAEISWNTRISRVAQRAPTLTLLSPSNLPMEDDPDVLQVARAIAERGVGRYWDDFPETDAFDTDQGDLIEYARAAVEIFRQTAPQPASAAQRPLPPVAGWRVKLDNGWVLYEREREARDSLFARTGSPVEPLYALTATSSVVHAQCAAPSEVLEQICQITNVGRGDVLSLQDALHEIHRIATAALTSTECGEDNG